MSIQKFTIDEDVSDGCTIHVQIRLSKEQYSMLDELAEARGSTPRREARRLVWDRDIADYLEAVIGCVEIAGTNGVSRSHAISCVDREHRCISCPFTGE